MLSEFSPNTPIYLQIMQGVKLRIVSGQWPPGMRVPPVRELSVEFGVNPNTAQRSLTELEREGLVYTERTAGRYITKDEALIQQMQRQMAANYIQDFLEHMHALGYSQPEIVEMLRDNGEVS